MAANEPGTLGEQFAPITAKEARGNSRPVSAGEFQSLAAEGRRTYTSTGEKQSTAGLDKDWEGTKDRAFKETRDPWGGATINSATGAFMSDSAAEVASKNKGESSGQDQYALTVKQPGQPDMSVPPLANRAQFGTKMDEARAAYPQLANAQHHLGVFHDADKESIDIDPVLVVRTPHEVETVGAYTRAVGGAYHFASGKGYFPPHVAKSDEGER